MAKIAQFTLIVLVATVLLPTDAMAYIDPGSGSAIISAIIGFVVAIGLLFKTFWYKISSIFKRKPSAEDKTTSDS